MPNISKEYEVEEGEILDGGNESKKEVHQAVSRNLKLTHKKESTSAPISKTVRKELKTTSKKISSVKATSLPINRSLPINKQKFMAPITTPHKIDMLAGLLDDKPPTKIEVPNIRRKQVLVKPEKRKVKFPLHPLDDVGFQLDLLAHYVDNW